MAAQFAGRLALIAFAITEVRGLIAGGDFATVTKSSLLATLAFFALGWTTGELARRIVEESARGEFEAALRRQQPQDNAEATAKATH
ncbi:MAG: hypothetical protein ACE5KM_11845 [Planctomycetaceae bacterium]